MPAPLTGTVVGKFLTTDLKGSPVPLRGKVKFTPVPAAVLAPGEAATYLPAPVTAQLDRSGQLWRSPSVGVTLVATSDPALNPTGFTYEVSFDLLDPEDKRVVYSPFNIAVPAGQTVDLAVVAPVSANLGSLSVLDGGSPSGPVTAVRFRRGTAASWVAANPVLAAGERGVESDTGKAKTGDGVTAWAGLAYEGVDDVRLSVAVGVGATAAALSATYATPANLDPLQPRGLTVKKLGIVLPVGTAAWENWLVESPNVVFDPITQQWLMVYVGYSTLTGAADAASVGLATSLDGVNWTRTGTPLIQGTGVVNDPDRYGTTGPSLTIKDGVYHLFYIGLDAAGYEGGTKRMMLATATSLSGPWTRRGVIIAPSAAGNGWRSTAIYHRSIIKHPDGKFYMFFNAYGVVATVAGERIGYATATDLLGPWTVDDVNSPLLGLGTPGSWEDETVGDPSIYRVGDTWYMAYYGFDGVKGQDGVAHTSNFLFPLGWTKHPQNPILKTGPTNSIDDMHAHKPNIVQTPGAIYHYYTAVGNGQPTAGKRSIALAIDSPSAVPNDRLNPKPVVDTFSRGGDSATTLGTAPTGQAWTNDVGVWRHVNSFAEVITLGAGSIAIASLDAGYADSKTSMKILTPASVGAALGLIFRMIDASNFIWADVDSTGISLVKKVAGADTVMVAKVARTIAAGDTITVYAYGTSITVQHNGVTVISTVELFASTAGVRRGFRNYAGGGAQVDDLMVTPS